MLENAQILEPFAKLLDALGACVAGFCAPVAEPVGLVVVPRGFVVELPTVGFDGAGDGPDGALGGIVYYPANIWSTSPLIPRRHDEKLIEFLNFLITDAPTRISNWRVSSRSPKHGRRALAPLAYGHGIAHACVCHGKR